MEVKSISFTGKTPKIKINQKAYNKALEEAFGQSNKDYAILIQKTKSQPKISTEKFIENAKKFFSGVFGQ